MDIALNDREREVLHRLIQDHCGSLSHEIHKTDRREFRQQLEQEEAVCRALLDKLSGR